jgi:tripartite ATP-independent transporter DctM subunit
MTTVLVVALIVLALFGAPIFAVLGGLAVLGAALTRPDVGLAQAFAGALVRVFHLATSAEGSTLATIPLFTFMGYVLAESRTADRLVSFAKAAVGWIPGGLSVVTIFVCAVFTTVTGASGVTIVAVGGLVMPALLKEGYKERFALGLVTSTGSIGLLFPPALPLIIYGIIYGISAQATAAGGGDTMQLVDFDLGRFLLAGIVPGLVLCGGFMLYSIYVAVRDRVQTIPFVIGEAVRTFLVALPELVIPGLMLLLMLIGLSIPEASAVTALYVVILETLVYRDVHIAMVPRICKESLQLVGAIFILIVAATALTDYFVYAHIPERLTGWMIEHMHSKVTFLLALNVMLLIVGCLMDIFTALLVVVPLIAPAATSFGIDPYHLGVIFLLNLEIGYVHPPVGLNLFIAAFRFRRPMTELYWAVLPFLLIMLIVLGLVTYVPALTPIKARGRQESAEKTAAAGAPAAAGARGGPDAGVVRIVWPDAAVWTPARCEQADVKGDTLAYADCQTMFKLYARCDGLAEELDRIECRDKAIAGEDPFAGPDAGR